jgi:hypothetical protein
MVATMKNTIMLCSLQSFWESLHTASIFYPEDGDSRFVQNIGKFLLALKHIPEDCILQVNVFVYWFMNIADIVNQSLDLNKIQHL